MKAEYINLFVDSVKNVWATMFNSEVKRGTLKLLDTTEQTSYTAAEDTGRVKRKSAPTGDLPYSPMKSDITALIGLTGRARGTIALSFPARTALTVARSMLGTPDLRKINEVVVDAVAEIVNMVAGGAKAALSGDGEPIKLILPTVVQGQNFEISYPTGSVWLEIPLRSAVGPFTMQVSFEMLKE